MGDRQEGLAFRYRCASLLSRASLALKGEVESLALSGPTILELDFLTSLSHGMSLSPSLAVFLSPLALGPRQSQFWEVRLEKEMEIKGGCRSEGGVHPFTACKEGHCRPKATAGAVMLSHMLLTPGLL